jgi:hypothetical protein
MSLTMNRRQFKNLSRKRISKLLAKGFNITVTR